MKGYRRQMAKRTDRLTEVILRKIEGLRAEHGPPGQPMKQKTLARRSGQTYARVHAFISGKMPYPPMDFLDALLRTFGTTLADELKGGSTPPAQLPIVREDILELAKMLDDASPEAVERVKGIAELFSTASAAAEATGRTDRAPEPGKTRAAGAKRSTRAARRPD